jgi:hypothetical protein
VWLGYDDNQPIKDEHGRNISGGSLPAHIFSLFMAKTHEEMGWKP